MKITVLAEKLVKLEGLKKPINIAQVKEVLKCLNSVTLGAFYKWVRTLK